MTRRVLAAAGAAAAVLTLAPSVAGAATRTVFAGGDGVVRNAPAQFSPNAFLRQTVTVHVGDTVRWNFRGFHTVTVPRSGDDPPGFAVPGTDRVSGVLDGNNQPFWFNGQLPVINANPQVAAPTSGATYTGRAFRNSGLPSFPNPRPYSLRFTRAGTFNYFCAVHPGMVGRVRVVGSSRRIPTEAQNQAAANAELRRLAAAARAAAAAPATAGVVEAGRAPRRQRFTINAFFPSAITVKVGTQLRFTMAGQNRTEGHTVTLGPLTRDQVPFVTPTGGINPVAAYPSDPPNAFPPYVGTNHGNGFLNLGLLDNDPATDTIFANGAITFGTPGQFSLKCLIHDGMDVTVTVTS